jgi:predicted RNase H-like HicB family nuclease
MVGKKPEEALTNVQKAIRGHIEALRQLGREIPAEKRVKIAV